MGEIRSQRSYENKSADPEFHNLFLEMSVSMSLKNETLDRLQTLVTRVERLREVEHELEEYTKRGIGIDDNKFTLLLGEKETLSTEIRSVTIMYDGRPIPSLEELTDRELDIIVQANKNGKEQMQEALITLFNSIPGDNPKRKDMLH